MRLLIVVTGLWLAMSGARLFADEQLTTDMQWLAGLMQSSCQNAAIWPPDLPAPWRASDPRVDDVRFRGNIIGKRVTFELAEGGSLRIDKMEPGGQPRRWIAETRDAGQLPQMFLGLDQNCKLRQLRRLHYVDGRASRLEIFDGGFQLRSTEFLNPPLTESATRNSNSILVAMVDAGVNYQLPAIRDAMAVDFNGRPVGYDFRDMDAMPFDGQSGGSPFFVQRHGTRTASLLIQEAPGIGLVSYRYPGTAMNRMEQLISHAAGLGVRIVGLPLGSNRQENWIQFAAAARAHPEMLFVVSAGNNGRNIDLEPVYPAALDLENMIVVTSADDFVRPAERTNWGRLSVDYLVPAEQVDALDFSGETVRASGSSYAVSRVAALAASLLAANPTLDTSGLIESIRHNALAMPDKHFVAAGYIPDPLAHGAKLTWSTMTLSVADKIAMAKTEDVNSAENPLPSITISLGVLNLDPAWQPEQIAGGISAADEILNQCGIRLSVGSALQFDGSDYLRDLETGRAHTLFSSVDKSLQKADLRIVFARDTRMSVQFDAEAFGHGNTRSRPWLRNTLWVMQGARDLGITIAHELFHVLANDGSHPTGPRNLMGAETGPDRTDLTPGQCAMARGFLNRS